MTVGMKLLIVLIGVFASIAHASDCSSGWERYSEKPYEMEALPDTNAVYWRYRFENEKDLVLKVEGKAPDARYFSFSLYDQATMDPSIGVADYQMRKKKDGSYVLHVAPASWAEWGGNTLRVPPKKGPKKQFLELWFRAYAPASGMESITPPKITALTAEEPLVARACPKGTRLSPSIDLTGESFLPLPQKKSIHFYRLKGHGLYANVDNRYLVSRLDFRRGEVAMLRFKAPQLEKDVRYWSLCVGGISTRTSACLKDADTLVNDDGTVTFVIGPPELEKEVVNRGFNFIPRGKLFVPVLLYRNLIPEEDFKGNFSAVREWSRAEGTNVEPFEAERFIGEYAPTGEHTTAREFLIHCPEATKQGGSALAQDRAPKPSSAPFNPALARAGMSWEPAVTRAILTVGPAKPFDREVAQTTVKGLLESFLKTRIKVSAEVDFAPADTLARQVATGERDLAIVPGVVYSWLARFYPELDVLAVLGRNPGESSSETVMVSTANTEFGELADWKGVKLRLATNTSFSTLVALQSLFDRAGISHYGFFGRPAEEITSLHDALADVAESARNPEVTFVEKSTFETYCHIHPGICRSRLQVVKTLPALPAHVLVYLPKRWKDSDVTAIRNALARPMDTGDEMLATMIRGPLGFGYAEPPTPAFRASVASLSSTLKYPGEYILPEGFFAK